MKELTFKNVLIQIEGIHFRIYLDMKGFTFEGIHAEGIPSDSHVFKINKPEFHY